MQRRAFFRHLSRVAALGAWQQWLASHAQAQTLDAQPWQTSEEVFTLGVASGEPRANSLVIWTRLAPKPLQADGGMPTRAVSVRWVLATDERCQHIVQQGAVSATPDAAHSVHVLLEGLAPGQRYFYRFEAGGQRSPVGRTRTAPADDAQPERLRLALTSCQHYEQGYFTAHREIAQADIDLVLFAGDYIYTSRKPGYQRVREHPHEMPSAHTLADYRVHHAIYKLDADLRACHAAHPWLLIWDDHEVMSDYTAQRALDEEDPQVFLAARTAAYRAYFEHQPLSPRRAPVNGGMPMHDRYAWGRLVDLWTLDTRQFRDAPPCQDRRLLPPTRKLLWRCEQTNDKSRTPLGMAQEYWLADGLAGSLAAWKLVLQTTQITPGPLPLPGTNELFLYADGWDAFPAARRRLMEAIAQPRVRDVVFLGGDVHRHVAANLRLDPLDPQSPIVASELVASSISSRGLSEWITSAMRRRQPDLLHCRSDQRGYALLELNEQRLTCDFMATAHPVRADSQFARQARYVIERGRPGPVRA